MKTAERFASRMLNVDPKTVRWASAASTSNATAKNTSPCIRDHSFRRIPRVIWAR